MDQPGNGYRPVERPVRLPDEIARQMTIDIRNGRFKIGAKLPSEKELASAFAVSRAVVREAVAQLKHDGMVDARQGIGAFVVAPAQRTVFRISPECFDKRQALRQILELLGGVQAEAAALAATHRSNAHLTTLATALQRMRAPIDGESAAEARLESEIAFYGAIADASANVYIIEFVDMLNRRVRTQLWSVAWKNTRVAEVGSAVLREHQRIHAAIERQDPAAARDAARLHFGNAAERLTRRRDLADQ